MTTARTETSPGSHPPACGRSRLNRLSAGELADLREYADYARGNAQHYRKDIPSALQPLLDPVELALDRLQGTRRRRRAVITMMLLHMDETQTSYQEWTPDQWIAFLDRVGDREQPDYIQSSYTTLVSLAYRLADFTDFHRLRSFTPRAIARQVFGQEAVERAVGRVNEGLLQLGYTQQSRVYNPSGLVGWLLLLNHSPHLEDIQADTIRAALPCLSKCSAAHMRTTAQVLIYLGLIHPSEWERSGEPRGDPHLRAGPIDIPQGWWVMYQRWRAQVQANRKPASLRTYSHYLLKIGRWLKCHHPAITGPEQWDRSLASEFALAVSRMKVGEFTQRGAAVGAPLYSANSQAALLRTARIFFEDCQQWGWIPKRFTPRSCFRISRTLQSQLTPRPRTIADDVWAKLLAAGLHLKPEDLGQRHPYPFEMVHALAVVWLFCALRADQIRHLARGCIQWMSEDTGLPETSGSLSSKRVICLMSIPPSKSSPAFIKPVDAIVGKGIETWEQIRPATVPVRDARTGNEVQYLFQYRGLRLGQHYLNKQLIPLLCGKAGLEPRDARGRITSHRARSTIASQLLNAREPMSVLELQEWLGLSSPDIARHYLESRPGRLSRAYREAGYFGHNIRIIEVLVDREAILSGSTTTGLPWKYYDLGHGYCTYDFFSECPHRMACARCSFYVPKGSSQAQMLGARTNLLRLLEQIPLTEDERFVVEDDVQALGKLLARLSTVPTPQGDTPGELGTEHNRIVSSFIPLDEVK